MTQGPYRKTQAGCSSEDGGAPYREDCDSPSSRDPLGSAHRCPTAGASLGRRCDTQDNLHWMDIESPQPLRSLREGSLPRDNSHSRSGRRRFAHVPECPRGKPHIRPIQFVRSRGSLLSVEGPGGPTAGRRMPPVTQGSLKRIAAAENAGEMQSWTSWTTGAHLFYPQSASKLRTARIPEATACSGRDPTR